ncbi:hypothetical protein SAMN05216419_100933 [Nitrosomonas cryotolerans]|uniref:Uncharacterized protein n=1 Tax=Nitrosomonas cryotolerans ATCC 49181 TaxID=1131553 RepID=A0A1N6IC05_9PROT|nr:hypothetical protein [Nitrosomonas cryotolerans]SFP61214.1 hypothetical protein SAMN05216419_100933 [Nitrosomonas cryotolerans]SIO29547.1 hypothetical protein SAMN02743940_1705 [Nitrosomonas cryotolerans ATCC 49181]
MEITCYRDSEISRESRYLPAVTYNLAITLLARCATGHLFVPIRSMQYLAILDAEEFVFVDGERKCWIDIAWCHFQSQGRTALDQPVAYDAIYYREDQAIIMARLQREFPAALQVLAKKTVLEGPARIIKFPPLRS